MGDIPPSALRRPPPPGCCLVIDSNKRVNHFRRCKKANPSNSNSMILSLPDEVLMEILLRLSADEICDNARLVCLRWFHLIHTDAFVREHLHRASSGLILRPHIGSSPVFVTATTQGKVEISKLIYRMNFAIRCSCNGLALCLRQGGYDLGEGITSFIFNPATKCAFDLPRFPDFLDRRYLLSTLGMAYAAASMAYKVFASYRVKRSGIEHFVMVTVGVDKTWRHVKLEGLSPEARKLITNVRTPLITGSFLHWVSDTLVVSLNAETEIFTLTPTPALMFPQEREVLCFHLSTGECISLFILRGDNWSWEVWEMKPETWEWRKVLPKISLVAHKRKIQQFALQKDDVLEPVGWVRYPEVLAFCFIGMGRYCIIYNLDTKEFQSIELSNAPYYHIVVQHRNTLVWSERC